MMSAVRAIAGILALTACGFEGGATTTPEIDAAVPPMIDAPRGDAPMTDWWNTDWQFRRRITIDNSQLTATLVNFPVLVALGDTTNMSDGGADLRFVDDAPADPADTLNHDIDTFLPNVGRVWVGVDIAPPPAPPRAFWLYYGNLAVTGAEDRRALWEPWTSVHHLSNLEDASETGHDATAMVTPSYMTGQIGDAVVFDANQALRLPRENEYDYDNTMSASVWFRATSLDVDWQAILTKGDAAWRFHRHGGAQHVTFSTNLDTNGANNQDLEGATIPLNDWHHAALLYDNDVKRLIVDGALVMATFAGPINKTNAVVAIGENAEFGNRLWRGQIDEVRISSNARSVEWMQHEYRAVVDPTFVDVGDPLSRP